MPQSILIIEDERINAEILKLSLEAEGHRVTLASTAEEGLALARVTAPDIVFMDIGLPGSVDGIEAVRTMKGSAWFYGRIVCQSGRCTETEVQECLEAGADAYMAKPYRRRDILDMVRRFGAAAPG